MQQVLIKNWKLIAIVLVVVIVFALVYKAGANKKPGFWDWLMGFQNQEEKDKPDPKDLPNSGTGIPAGWDPDVLAKKLFDAMDGLTLINNGDLFDELAELATDDMVVAVYNHFNEVYGGGETLYEWIEGEWSAPGWAWKKEKALHRLEMLGCV